MNPAIKAKIMRDEDTTISPLYCKDVFSKYKILTALLGSLSPLKFTAVT